MFNRRSFTGSCRLLVDLFLLRLAVQRVAASRVILYYVDRLFDEILGGDRQSAHELVDAYNDECIAKDNPPDHKKLPNSEHDPYIERIAAAIYLQSGFEELKEWAFNWLLPKIDIKSL